MLPWGHLAVGYLAYTLAIRAHRRRPPRGPAVIALAIGTQLPDLLDKPLNAWVGLLPSGRSMGHSLLVALVLGLAVWYLARRYDHEAVGIAFGVGYVSHVVADSISLALAQQWAMLGYLLWPVTPAYRYPGEADRDILAYLLVNLTTPPHFELGLFALAIVVWIYDGRPGLSAIRSVR